MAVSLNRGFSRKVLRLYIKTQELLSRVVSMKAKEIRKPRTPADKKKVFCRSAGLWIRAAQMMMAEKKMR